MQQVDEDDDDSLSPSLKIPAGAKNYVTPVGFARMNEELEHLVKRERPKVVEVVAWAASNGDRSENGDYLYGKKRLREIDRRIRFLTKRLAYAEVVDPAARAATDQVFFGATVAVIENGADENVYAIVGIDETDAGRGRISWTSPLARCLLKAREGDLVRFQSPAGVREIEIVEVMYVAID